MTSNFPAAGDLKGGDQATLDLIPTFSGTVRRSNFWKRLRSTGKCLFADVRVAVTHRRAPDHCHRHGIGDAGVLEQRNRGVTQAVKASVRSSTFASLPKNRSPQFPRAIEATVNYFGFSPSCSSSDFRS